jgi:hypothetical protein
VRNASTTNDRSSRRRRRRVAAALAAGIFTVVVGSLDTASAKSNDSRQVQISETRQISGGAAGGRLTFR